MNWNKSIIEFCLQITQKILGFGNNAISADYDYYEDVEEDTEDNSDTDNEANDGKEDDDDQVEEVPASPAASRPRPPPPTFLGPEAFGEVAVSGKGRFKILFYFLISSNSRYMIL